jgi:hypothetical protein
LYTANEKTGEFPCLKEKETIMKRIILVVALAALALGTVGVDVASARGNNPPGGHCMHDGQGVLHTFIVTEFARELNLNVNDINTRLAAGDTLRDIALSAGVSAEDFPAIMQEVRANALEAAVKANVITQEQADRMLSRGFGQGGMRNGNGNGNCDGTGPHGNQGNGGGRQNGRSNP